MYVCVCVVPVEARDIGSPWKWSQVWGLPDMGVGNRTWVLWKSSACSSLAQLPPQPTSVCFWDKVSYIPGWPQIYCIAKAVLGLLLILLALPLECRDYWQICVLLGSNPDLCWWWLGKYSYRLSLAFSPDNYDIDSSSVLRMSKCVVHACNPSIWESERGWLQQVWVPDPRLQSQNLSKKKKI